jgi:hypothetical protein
MTSIETIRENATLASSSKLNEDEDEAVIVISQVVNENSLQKTSTNKIKVNDLDEEFNDNQSNRPLFENQYNLVENTIPSNLLSLMRKESANLIEYPGGYVNILRKKLLRHSLTFVLFDCPKGFGYYLLKENDCSLFKLCEYWDRNSAIVTLNKCLDDKIFNFKTLRCVSRQELDENYFYNSNQNCVANKFSPI